MELQVGRNFITPKLYGAVFVEKLTVPQQVKNCPHVLETEGSLPHSQVSPTSVYPEADTSSLFLFILLNEDPF